MDSIESQRCSSRGQNLGVHVGDRQSHHHRFQHLAQFEDFLKFGLVDLMNDRPFMRPEIDQTFGSQVMESLSNRSGAHAQIVGKVRLNQPAPTWYRSTENLTPELVPHVILGSRLASVLTDVAGPLRHELFKSDLMLMRSVGEASTS